MCTGMGRFAARFVVLCLIPPAATQLPNVLRPAASADTQTQAVNDLASRLLGAEPASWLSLRVVVAAQSQQGSNPTQVRGGGRRTVSGATQGQDEANVHWSDVDKPWYTLSDSGNAKVSVMLSYY